MTINNNIPVRSPQEDVGNWRKGIAQWQVNGTLYLSVPFTWLLPKAHALAVAHQGPVQAGGPAVQLMPDYLAKVATVNQPCPDESSIVHAVALCRAYGLTDIRIYVLIGFDDTPDDALYRLDTVRGWGLLTSPMRYQPLDTLGKNQYVAPGWSHRKLQAMMRCYSRNGWTGHIALKDYRRRQCLNEPTLF